MYLENSFFLFRSNLRSNPSKIDNRQNIFILKVLKNADINFNFIYLEHTFLQLRALHGRFVFSKECTFLTFSRTLPRFVAVRLHPYKCFKWLQKCYYLKYSNGWSSLSLRLENTSTSGSQKERVKSISLQCTAASTTLKNVTDNSLSYVVQQVSWLLTEFIYTNILHFFKADLPRYVYFLSFP